MKKTLRFYSAIGLTAVALTATQARAQSIYTPYTFTTLAGNSGYGSVDGTNRDARFFRPYDTAVDSSGNVYVADNANNTIRKMTPKGTNWVTTTLAGLGEVHGAIDATGSVARFYGPAGVVVDGAGNVYVSDQNNSTIRKVTPAGVVTTLAGLAQFNGTNDGAGSTALFSFPTGLALDRATNLYVADTYNYTIRKVTPAGVVTTLAGMGGISGTNDGTGSAARFGGPFGVAVDGATNVYVSDNDTIRRVTPAGVVTTIAGLSEALGGNDGTNSDARFLGPAMMAVDGATNLYVADSSNDNVRKVSPMGTNWVTTTLAGLAGADGDRDGTGTFARFNQPFGLSLDSSNNVYVADNSNSNIRKVTPAGVVTTIAGGPAGTYGTADGTNSDARFSNPAGVAVDGAGNLYVADTYNYTIRQVTPAGIVTTLAGLPGILGGYDGTGNGAAFDQPNGVAVDSATNIYVADTANHTIRMVTLAGVVTTLAGQSGVYGTNDGTGSGALFYNPNAVAVDRATNVYVADTYNNTIRRLTPAGTNGVVTTLAGSPQFDEFGSPIGGFADGTGTNALFTFPMGVAVDSATNIYVADTGNDAIRLVTPAGVVTTIAGGNFGSADGTNGDAQFQQPTGIAVGADGNLYVSDTYNQIIRKLTHAGTNWVVTTLGGVPLVTDSTDGTGSVARFNYPMGVAVDDAGNVYVMDTSNNTIRKGTPPALFGGPVIVAGSAGFSGGHFGFNLTGPSGNQVVVDRSTNLLTWLPVWTNTFGAGLLPFSDTQSGTLSNRFYRAHTP